MDRVLSDLKDAIKEGLTKGNDYTTYIQKVEANIESLLQGEHHNHVLHTAAHDLIIDACKCKNKTILMFFLFESEHFFKLRNTRLEEQHENMLRIEAFYHALRDDNMEMVNMLYHYWGGGTHWPNQSLRVNAENVRSIERLYDILNEAKTKCKLQLIYDQNMKVKIHGFLTFIKYQLNVYNKLEENKKRRNTSTPNAVADVNTVLREYENFKQIQKFRLPTETSAKDEELALLEISDKTTICPEMFYHHLYYTYYKELDYYTALFFLDNLHLLKKNYKVQDKDIQNFYHEIECKIFHYIFRISEKWLLYVPSEPRIHEQKYVIQKEKPTPISIKINLHKLDNTPVIFLERRQFENCLMDLPKRFKDTNYENGNNTKNNRAIKFDQNYLKYLPDLRDYYSLKKTIYYIKAVENDRNANALCIQRALMVFGEMTKSTEQSEHLSSTARILLEARISLETMNLVKEIRNNLAKANQGKLNKRIEVTKQNMTIFRHIQMELNAINKHIQSVADVYECILNESLVQQGLDLIDARINEWSSDARKHMDYIHGTLDKLEKAEYKANEKALKGKLDQAEDAAKEMKRKLQYEKLKQKTGLSDNYILEIELTLKNRKTLQNKLKILNNYSKSIVKSELPKCIPIIYNKLNGMRGLDNNKKKTLFESVKDVLIFFSKFDAFEEDHANQKVLESISEIEGEIQSKVNHSADQSIADQSIADLISTIGNYHSRNYETFKNIKELKALLITKSYHSDRREIDELLSDLKYLIGNLRAVLEYNQRPTTKQLLFKYDRDQNFRLSFEMLLSDILNIFCVCGIGHTKLLEKPDKLLTSINMRNVLAHGNPILEILGDVLDSNDLAATLLEKAMAVAEAGPTIEALHKLFYHEITVEIIKKNKTKTLTSEQKKLLDELKACNGWEIYLDLINTKNKKPLR